MKIDRELAGSLVRDVLQRGADHAEAFLQRSTSLKVEVKKGELSAMEHSEEFGYSLRVLKDNRLGFSYSNDPSETGKVAGRALESLGFTREDVFQGLPSPEEGMEYPEIMTSDPGISAVDSRRALGFALEVEKAAFESDQRMKKTRKASAAFTTSEIYILNSRGISHGYDATTASASITAVAEEKGDSQMGWGYEGGRLLRDMDFSRAGREAASRACSMLGAERATPHKASLIVDNSVAVDFLSVVSSMISAENVQKGKSLLDAREGKRIMSRSVNIIDNPLADHSPSCRPMDGEGVRSRRNVFVSEGVLMGYMHNTYTGKKGNALTTGNAIRGGAFSLPGVGPLSLTIEPSDKPLGTKDMIAGVDRGMIVMEAMGVHTINPISGDFSIGVSGISIKGGKAQGPVKEAVISGNILEFFNSIEALGDDLRYFGSMGAPSLLVSGIDLSA